MRPLDFTDALISLAPNSVWAISGNDYSTLEWHSDDVQKPSLKEIKAELDRLIVEQELTAYKAQRSAHYPDPAEYLDGIVKGDLEQVQGYIEKCLAVKAMFPKPGE
jgi:hypothetical protein